MNEIFDKRKTKATLLLFSFALWQVSVLSHLITVNHRICPHGKIVDNIEDRADKANKCHHSDSDHQRHNGGHDHEDCSFLKTLTSPKIAVGPLTPDIFALLDGRLDPLTADCPYIPTKSDLFELSPSHSPPFVA